MTASPDNARILNTEEEMMIKKSSAMKDCLIENMRGGEGTVMRKDILGEEDMAKHSRLFSLFTLRKGCSIGEHEHKKETEYYYILSGKGIVREKDGLKDVGPGDVVITGDGESHSIANTGDEDLIFVAVIILD